MINIDFVKVKVYRNTGSNKVTRILFVYTNKEAADWEYAYFVENGKQTTVRVLTKDIAVNVPSDFLATLLSKFSISDIERLRVRQEDDLIWVKDEENQLGLDFKLQLEVNGRELESGDDVECISAIILDMTLLPEILREYVGEPTVIN